MSNNDKLCCHPNWEAECKRLTDELNKLKEECHYMNNLYAEAKQELAAAQAKLEMVYLIFGKGRC